MCLRHETREEKIFSNLLKILGTLHGWLYLSNIAKWVAKTRMRTGNMFQSKLLARVSLIGTDDKFQFLNIKRFIGASGIGKVHKHADF